MTRICEKFVENLSSGPTNLTDEMQTHLLTCPECQQALAAVKLLQQQRKPITGKEAVAIAGIIKAVQTEAAIAATGTTTAAAAPPAAMLGKIVAAIAIVLSMLFIASSAMINAPSLDQTSSTPVQTNAPPSAEPAITEDSTVNTAAPIATNDAETPAALPADNATASDSAHIASQSANEQENDDTTKARTIMVSPDQEEVDPR